MPLLVHVPHPIPAATHLKALIFRYLADGRAQHSRSGSSDPISKRRGQPEVYPYQHPGSNAIWYYRAIGFFPGKAKTLLHESHLSSTTAPHWVVAGVRFDDCVGAPGLYGVGGFFRQSQLSSAFGLLLLLRSCKDRWWVFEDVRSA